MTQATILSVQVGKPKTHKPNAPGEREWRSAIVKLPVEGPVALSALNLEGDGQYNKKHHGGPTRALNFYPAEHYPFWHETPELAGMVGGAFGENLTTSGLLEETVCIGDVYQVGKPGLGPVIFITQPRGPCTKLDRRWNYPGLMEISSKTGRTGWYAGVRQTGVLAAGDTLDLLERPHPEWTIARVWALNRDGGTPEGLREIAGLPALAEGYRKMFQDRLAR